MLPVDRKLTGLDRILWQCAQELPCMTFSPDQRRLARRGVLAVVVLAIIAFLVVMISRNGAQTQPDPKEPSATETGSGSFHPTADQWGSLTIEPVRTAPFDTLVTADGTVVVNDNTTANVFSQFSGRVTSINGQPGQSMRKGTVLLTLLATETAQLKGDLAAASAAEATTRRQLDLAKVTEKRQHELLLAEAAAEKDWLQSQADLAIAENAERAAQAAVASAREKAAVLTSHTPGSSGQGNAEIVAPIDGVIVQRQVAPGQFVNSLAAGGGTPLFTISDLRTVWVLASVSEIDATRIKIGQPVEISALALPGRKLRSTVSWVAASVDPTTHRLPVRAELRNLEGALKPQMSVTVRMLETEPVARLAIPRSAIVYDGQQAHCYVETSDRTLTVRKLQIGRVQGELAEVKAGLAAGDRVLTRGPLFIDRAADGSS